MYIFGVHLFSCRCWFFLCVAELRAAAAYLHVNGDTCRSSGAKRFVSMNRRGWQVFITARVGNVFAGFLPCVKVTLSRTLFEMVFALVNFIFWILYIFLRLYKLKTKIDCSQKLHISIQLFQYARSHSNTASLGGAKANRNNDNSIYGEFGEFWVKRVMFGFDYY